MLIIKEDVDVESKILESIDRYYNSLKVLGYKPQKDVNTLLVLSFVNKLLSWDTANFITDKDYQSIDRALNCIYGSCLVPFPEYRNCLSQLKYKYNNIPFRGLEGSFDARFTEDIRIRVKDIT